MTDDIFKEPPFTLQDLVWSCEGDFRPFLTFYQADQVQSRLSFDEYFRCAAHVAAQIQSLVVVDAWQVPIAISSSNSDDFLIVYGACFLLGAIVVPISPAESSEYIERVLSHAECKLFISQETFLTEICSTVSMASFDSSPSTSSAKVISSHSQGQSGDLPAAIFYTSGTTGTPKGVVLSHSAILANLKALKCAHRFGPDSIHYCVLPLYHVNAFGFSFLTTLLANAQVVLSDRFRSDCFWKIILDEKCQTSSLVPEVVSQLVARTTLSWADQELLSEQAKYFVSAASALSRDLLVKFLKKFSVKIYQGYGLSETVNFSLLLSPQMDADCYESTMLSKSRPSAGSALIGNEVSVKRLLDGQDCAEGEVGEIIIRGQNLMSYYLKNELATKEAFKGGWFHTGDLGYFEVHQGVRYFFISGRIKEVVKRNSETIYVQEVEESLQTIEGCLISAVTGFENYWSGEELAAAVVKDSATPSVDDILSRMRSKVGYSKSPKVIRFVDAIPRTASMKVKRYELGAIFSEFSSTRFIENCDV